MMTYQETTDYLFNAAPLFQQVGAGAYKEGLDTTLTLDAHFGHPHQRFRTIHVAGTNGKGSCSHTLAAVLQKAGYKVGLFTSPHLVDFRERIRVNGEMIPEEYVVDFVATERSFFEPLHPSFFEITTAMAFKYFADQHVDIVVIEVGLGGRLDCTNIITPEVSIITNISFDHVAFLGDTLAKIAGEKAGIIKSNVPVIIGESLPETRPVFEAKAQEVGAPIYFAEESGEVISCELDSAGEMNYETETFGRIHGELGGYCQKKNGATILTALKVLRDSGLRFTDDAVHEGFAEVTHLTGLRGRWEVLHNSPFVVCDTGHNVGGFQYIIQQLANTLAHRPEDAMLRMVFGMVNDKDITTILSMLPKEATYYFCNASVKRALPAAEIAAKAAAFGLQGQAVGSVAEAYSAAKADANPKDIIYVGGSSFVVADFLRDH